MSAQPIDMRQPRRMPARPRARKMGSAVRSGDTLTVFQAMAGKIGDLLDDPELAPRDAAALMRRLQDLTVQIEALQKTSTSDKVRTASETPDEQVSGEDL